MRKASVLPGASRRPLPLRAALAVAVTAVTCVAALGLGAAPASAGTVVTVTLSGSAKGKVTSLPAGINCSNIPGAEANDCSFDYNYFFITPKLTAVAADGAAFKEWTGNAGGSCSGSTNPCETSPLFFDPLTANASFAPKPDAPSAVTGAASDIEFPTAVLSATVNPNSAEFSASECYFEYGTSTEYGFKDQCRPAPGSGTAPVSVTGLAALLRPGTTYHYRVVVVTAGGKSVGEDRTFTSAAAPADACPNAAIRAQQGAVAQRLPKCFAYEMVSPTSTAGTIPLARTSSPTGDDVLIESAGGFADVENLMNLGTIYRSKRSAEGWRTEALGGPPAASFRSYNLLQEWTADWWRDAKPRTLWNARPNGAASTDLQALVGVKGGPWVPLGPAGTSILVAADVDLRGVLLEGKARPQLTDGSVDTRVTTEPSLTVSYRQPDGSLDLRQVARQGDAALFPECPVTAGSANGVTRGAVRREGLTRIVFTTSFGCSEPEKNRVWVSEPFSSTPDAFDASASQCEDPCGPAERVEFAGASLDTERIYMTTTQRLVDADVDATADLYEYNFRRPAGDRLKLLTGNATSADVQGVLGVSDTGSHVYFVARGDLAGAVVSAGSPGPVAGSPNLYVRISGPVGQDPVLRFIGTLSENDIYQWVPTGQSDLTSDGRIFGFSSVAALTPDKLAGDAHEDKYRFDAQTGELRRLWVNDPAHNGSARVAGTYASGVLRTSAYANFEAFGGTSSMSADGGQFLLTTAEPLVAGDVNNATDYFLWDAADGSVTMLSDGRDPKGGRGARIAPDGESIFIGTASQLVPQHTASSVALYAIRRGGGFPAPADPAGPCVGDACQGQSPAPPVLPPAAGSVTFQGEGNVPDAPRSEASVSVAKLKAVTGTSATLKVKVPAAGRITVAGSSIRKVTRSATKAATYSLKISLSSAAKRSLAKKRSLGVTVKVTFAPKTGTAASKSVKLTFKQPKVKKKSRPAKTSASHRSSSVKGGR